MYPVNIWQALCLFGQNVVLALAFFVGFLPGAWAGQEGLDPAQRGVVKGLGIARFGQHIPPGTQVVQLNPMITKGFLGLGENAVLKDHRRVPARGPGFANRIDK